MYRAPSGALVFSAGTIQWTWGLDAEHDSAFDAEPADPRMQQAQVNLLADMGAQPTTLMSRPRRRHQVDRHHRPDRDHHARPPRAPTRPTAPASPSPAPRPTPAAASSPASRSRPTAGTPGTRPRARPRGPTRYVQHGLGPHADPGPRASTTAPTSAPSRPASFTVDLPVQRLRRRRCRRRRRPTTPRPSSWACASRPTSDGFVTGVRFYKGTGNTGTHVGSLWSATRHAPGHGDLHQRVRHRLADGDVRHARRGDGRARPTSCPTPRPRALRGAASDAFTHRARRRGAAHGRRRLRRAAGRGLRRCRARSRPELRQHATTSSTSLFTTHGHARR